nr:EOG090X04W0 [Triops cancriformis]
MKKAFKRNLSGQKTLDGTRLPFLWHKLSSVVYLFQLLYMREFILYEISPLAFNWSASTSFRKDQSNATTQGKGQITYTVSLPNFPDLPSWASLAYHPETSRAFLYGVAPSSAEKVSFEIVALNRATYETNQLNWELELPHRSETKLRSRKVRLLVHNINVVDFFTGDRKTKFLEIFTKELWPESGYDLQVVDLSSSLALGSRKPTNPSEKEGTLVILGSQMEFSDTLVDLQREVSPLWNFQPCPRDFKKTSVERHFRQKGFFIDWCSFRLASLISSDEEDKFLGERTLDPVVVPSVLDPAHSTDALDGIWRSPMKTEVPRRNFVHDGVLIVLGILLLGSLIIAGIATALAVHPDGGETADGQLYEGVFDEFGCFKHSLGTLDGSSDIPLRTYIAAADMGNGTGPLITNLGWGGYNSKEASPFLSTPKSTIPRSPK